jgi:hypothetical protein
MANLATNLHAEAGKERAHALIDQMDASQIPVAVSLLEKVVDPVAYALANAPLDDEPITAEEERAVAESKEWLKHNDPISHETLLAELGITPEELERSAKSSFERLPANREP